MALTNGTRVGPYEILSALGAGGMGEVYRARDTKLNREVAIKILPELFAADPERVARFTREAHVLAALNHPHIAQIYGLEEADGISALVMELVEGPTLADRIALGALPVDEALPIAKQIAEALEAAHEHGIIHRDLKPANIKIRDDGTVKVLDFGLAKALDPAASGAEAAALTNSPTITSPAAMTQRGVILGTAAYMAPEQAKGRAVDKRADIWAFGAVLFEMLTGQRAFPGEDVFDTLSAVGKSEPAWDTLPATTSPSIRKLLRRCLEKDPKRRMRDIGDARLEIDDALAGGDRAAVDGVPPVGGRGRPGRERLAWGVAAVATLLLVLALVAATRFFRRAPEPAEEVRLDVTTPPTTEPSLALSPDGRRLAYVATDGRQSRLWVRGLGSVTAQALPGTEGATYPFWSPDNTSLGFFADGKLKRIDAAGGPVQTLASAPSARGGAWSPAGVMVFAPTNSGAPLFQVPAAGGAATGLTRLAPSQAGHLSPQFLPDGKHFVFFALGTAEGRGEYVASLDAPDGRRLVDADAAAVVANDHLLFVRQGALVAQRIDQRTLTLAGDAVPVVEQVAVTRANSIRAVAAAGRTIAYRTGPSTGQSSQLTWVDRTGKPLGVVGEPDLEMLRSPELSPDGKRMAVRRAVDGNIDVWLIELARGVRTRFTFDPLQDATPVWSPDGSRVAFMAVRQGADDLYQKPASGAGGEALLLASPQNKWPQDWSPDARVLLYVTLDLQSGYDLWALPLAGDRQPPSFGPSLTVPNSGEPRGSLGVGGPFPVVKTAFNEGSGQFSPDGRWVAYQSDESGRNEIYVQPFPGPGGKWQVSASGGEQPRWRRDGRELYYVEPNGVLMAASIAAAADGSSLEVGAPVALFATRLALPPLLKQEYAVAADGRFLLNALVGDTATPAPITLILNWRPGGSK